MTERIPELVIEVENRNKQNSKLLEVLKQIFLGHFHPKGRVPDATGENPYRGEELVADDGTVTARHYHDTTPNQPGAVCARDVHYEKRGQRGSKVRSGKISIVCRGCPECPIGREAKQKK